MQIENMTAQVRPRTSWEAVDLGFLLVQRWWPTIILSWVMITLPVFVIAGVLLHEHPVWWAIVMWWLKPLFNRIPLHIVSRALFSEHVTLRSLLRLWPKFIFPHVIKFLTFYRFDPARSFNLPVWQLEELKGRARATRSQVLNKRHYSAAFGLTFMCLASEFVLFLSLYALILMFLPEYYAFQMMETTFEGESVWWVGILLNTLLYISYAIIEPFYVAAGFSLYITRRTELEGWDIEIIFRQLAQRVKHLSQVSVGLVLVVLLGMGSFSLSSDALAETKSVTTSTSGISNENAKQVIDEIMQTDEFKDTKEVSRWHYKHEDEEKDEDDKLDMSGLWAIGDVIAALVQLLIWVGVAALVVLAVYYFTRWSSVKGAVNKKQKQEPLPNALFGLEITPESLPDDVAASAMDLWQQGQVIQALSLLYRASLTTLVHRDGINLKGSATEGDCVRILARQKEKVSQDTQSFFKLLTRQWQFAAYAHRYLDQTQMSQLCQGWRQHFGVASS